jgi:glycosyltransferase involved in cell wall biosynthesis
MLEILVVANLRLAIPTWAAARIAGIPVVFDMVEHFPTMSRLHHAPDNLIRNVLKGPVIIRAIEYCSVRLVDHTFVVVEEQKQRLIRLGIDPDRIAVVSNTPIIGNGYSANSCSESTHGQSDEFRLVYFGLVHRGRGLGLMLRALRYVEMWENGPPPVKFMVIGDGFHLPELRALAHKLQVEDRVDFVGWKPPTEFSALLQRGHLGVIPHRVSEFWNHTIPNKLFDYMWAGLPVLCTPTDPVRRVVEAESCGVVIPERPKEVAKKILELRLDMEALKEMGCRGRHAVLIKYNWDQDGTVFLRSLARVVENQGAAVRKKAVYR